MVQSKSNTCAEPAGKPTSVEIQPKLSQEQQQPTPLATQQSPRPNYLTMNPDNATTITTITTTPPPATHPQNQIWQNATMPAQQQSSPKPHQFNKQTMQEQEQNRVVPPTTSGPSKEKGQNANTNNNKKQSSRKTTTETRDQSNTNDNNTTTTTTVEKPSVGSEEWHRLRRENHKQVERRRRETINEGINEIAKMIPGNEKNKGQILHRAAVHIRALKEQQAEALEKWTLEKLITEQAVNELGRQVESLKEELYQTRKENEDLKRRLSVLDNQQNDHALNERPIKRSKRDESTAAASSN